MYFYVVNRIYIIFTTYKCIHFIIMSWMYEEFIYYLPNIQMATSWHFEQVKCGMVDVFGMVDFEVLQEILLADMVDVSPRSMSLAE